MAAREGSANATQKEWCKLCMFSASGEDGNEGLITSHHHTHFTRFVMADDVRQDLFGCRDCVW